MNQLLFLPFLLFLLHQSFPLVTSQTVEALLSFKATIIEDPQNILSTWNTSENFCMWYGIICSTYDTNTSVISLNLSGLNLLRTISPDIGKLDRLRVLSLSNNRLVGQIPPSLSLLYNLEFLDLSNNHLSGKIPEFLATFPNLNSVNFSNNDFFGEIPSEGHFGYFSCSSFFGNRDLYSTVLGNCNSGKKAKGNKGYIRMRWRKTLAISSGFSVAVGLAVGITVKIVTKLKIWKKLKIWNKLMSWAKWIWDILNNGNGIDGSAPSTSTGTNPSYLSVSQ